MATYTRPHRTRASDLEPEWHVLDAEGKTLGRLSTEVAVLLQGKHRPTYVPFLNTGDFVVVVNAEKIRVTGNKLAQKIYYRHSGYHGGLKEETLGDLLERAPTRALKRAVKGMLPKNTVGRRMLSRLKLYTGDSHPHAAQINARPKPRVVEEPPAPAAEEKPRRRRAAAKAAAPQARQRWRRLRWKRQWRQRRQRPRRKKSPSPADAGPLRRPRHRRQRRQHRKSQRRAS